MHTFTHSLPTYLSIHHSFSHYSSTHPQSIHQPSISFFVSGVPWCLHTRPRGWRWQKWIIHLKQTHGLVQKDWVKRRLQARMRDVPMQPEYRVPEMLPSLRLWGWSAVSYVSQEECVSRWTGVRGTGLERGIWSVWQAGDGQCCEQHPYSSWLSFCRVVRCNHSCIPGVYNHCLPWCGCSGIIFKSEDLVPKIGLIPVCFSWCTPI